MQPYKYGVIITDHISNKKYWMKDDTYPAKRLFQTIEEAQKCIKDEYSLPNETYEVKEYPKD